MTTASEYYEQGLLLAKESKYTDAINAFQKAIEIDPNSPATEVKHMLLDIMAFYNKDLYNP